VDQPQHIGERGQASEAEREEPLLRAPVADHVEDDRDQGREERHRAVGVGLLTLAPAQVGERGGGDTTSSSTATAGVTRRILRNVEEAGLRPGDVGHAGPDLADKCGRGRSGVERVGDLVRTGKGYVRQFASTGIAGVLLQDVVS
jgi:hypothetical protein